MATKSVIEQSAEQYLKGQIVISNINYFSKKKNTPHESYMTTKGAFIFPLSGTCNIFFDNDIFTASYGTVIHGCPNKTLRFIVTSDEPFTYINLYYNTNKELLFQHILNDKDEIYNILNKLLPSSSSDIPNSSFEKNNLLSQLFALLYKEFITPEAKNNFELANEIATYIQEHYMLNLSLDFLAEIFEMTSNQLSYLFFSYKNIRPIQYLITCRLSAACDLLANSSMPIYEVSHKVGYEDSLFFSRIFKKHLGCSPRQFRTIYGKNYNKFLSSHDNAFLYLSARNS